MSEDTDYSIIPPSVATLLLLRYCASHFSTKSLSLCRALPSFGYEHFMHDHASGLPLKRKHNSGCWIQQLVLLRGCRALQQSSWGELTCGKGLTTKDKVKAAEMVLTWVDGDRLATNHGKAFDSLSTELCVVFVMNS
jgi:hypothetical protein